MRRPKVPRALTRLRRRGKATRLYYVLMIAGAVLVDVGVGMVFVPAAVVLAGLAIGYVGVVGLGMPEAS